MKKKSRTKLVHEGDYVAEVEVELIYFYKVKCTLRSAPRTV